MSEVNIITVTLNPALNILFENDYLHTGYKNSTSHQSKIFIDGSGINITKALFKIGLKSKAFTLLATDDKGQIASQILKKSKADIQPFFASGCTRTKVTILNNQKDEETVITDVAKFIKGNFYDKLNSQIIKAINKNDIVVLSENLPEGFSRDSFQNLIIRVHQKGGRVCLISRGISPEIYADIKPEYLALKLRELEKIFNYPVRTIEDIIGSVRVLLNYGIKNVLIEAPKKNQAFLFSNSNAYVIDYDESESEGTKDGGWYVFIAGFLAGKSKKISLKESLEYATAAGLFYSDQVGSKFPSFNDLEEVKTDIEAEKIKMKQKDIENKNEKLK